jgi:hypothetical protein
MTTYGSSCPHGLPLFTVCNQCTPPGLSELVINHSGVSVPVRASKLAMAKTVHLRDAAHGSPLLIFTEDAPTWADLHVSIDMFMSERGCRPWAIEVTPQDFARLSEDARGMRPFEAPTTPPRLCRNSRPDGASLIECPLPHEHAGPCANVSDEWVTAEMNRRGLGLAKMSTETLLQALKIRGFDAAGEALMVVSDQEMRAEMDRRGFICELHSVTHAVTMDERNIARRERDEWKQRAVDAEERLKHTVTVESCDGASMTVGGVVYSAVASKDLVSGPCERRTAMADYRCSICGAPAGEPCTSSCDDDSVAPEDVKRWGWPADSREAFEALRFNGKPVSRLPPPKQLDNSVPFLLEDLVGGDVE